MTEFVDKWLAAVDKKNSALCGGVDFAEYAMGRTGKGEGLPAGANKRDCILRYVEGIAPYCAAVKPNMRYFGRPGRVSEKVIGDLEILDEAIALAQSKDLVVIQDSKEADIGSTNDSGIFYAAMRGADAVTLAAFAGNMQEAAKQGQDRKISLISMCLMSNPDYERVKNMWVDVVGDCDDGRNEISYDLKHVVQIEGRPHVRHYIQLAHDAAKFGLGGIVVGAPSKDNHLAEEEVQNVAMYYGKSGLILVPGIGAQGGEVTMLARFFDPKRLICNVGRGLMFPNKAKTTLEDQVEAAKKYQTMLNGLRVVA